MRTVVLNEKECRELFQHLCDLLATNSALGSEYKSLEGYSTERKNLEQIRVKLGALLRKP